MPRPRFGRLSAFAREVRALLGMALSHSAEVAAAPTVTRVSSWTLVRTRLYMTAAG